MSVENWVLLAIATLGVIKTVMEYRTKKLEESRADKNEDFVVRMIEAVEEGKRVLAPSERDVLVKLISEKAGNDEVGQQFDRLVQKVTKGDKARGVTKRLDK